jgi:hypothetical protein
MKEKNENIKECWELIKKSFEEKKKKKKSDNKNRKIQ